MTTFTDGPAQGQTMFLKRAPLFLRVVRNPGDEWDALDMVDDTPNHNERIWVYHLVGEPTRMHVQSSRKGGGRRCGWYEGGEYRVVVDQPLDAVMRARDTWQVWARAESERRTSDA